MNDTQLKESIYKVLKQIAPETDPSSLQPNQDIRRTLDIDSYDFLMFLIGLHEEVGVEIPESDYGRLITTDDIIHYLSDHMPTKTP